MALLALAGCAQDRYQWNLSHAAFAPSARRLPESEREEIVRLYLTPPQKRFCVWAGRTPNVDRTL